MDTDKTVDCWIAGGRFTLHSSNIAFGFYPRLFMAIRD
jgi:hypothetical protein